MRFKRRKIDVVPPYVSMADIAFNLVLFFIILAKEQDDSSIQWVPAKATGTKPVASAKVSISVDQDNKVYLNTLQVSLRELTERVAVELGDRPPNDRTVLLKIHKETLAATFEPIMEAVSQAGGEVVHVIEEEQP